MRENVTPHKGVYLVPSLAPYPAQSLASGLVQSLSQSLAAHLFAVFPDRPNFLLECSTCPRTSLSAIAYPAHFSGPSHTLVHLPRTLLYSPLPTSCCETYVPLSRDSVHS